MALGVVCFATAGAAFGAVEAQPASIGLGSRQTIDYRFASSLPGSWNVLKSVHSAKGFDFANDLQGASEAAEPSTVSMGTLAFLPKADATTVDPALSERHDHLISQAVTSSSKDAGGTLGSMLLFWNASAAQADFGQMVADAKTSGIEAREPESTTPLLIPIPKALWTGLSGLAGLGIAAIWRRRASVA